MSLDSSTEECRAQKTVLSPYTMDLRRGNPWIHKITCEILETSNIYSYARYAALRVARVRANARVKLARARWNAQYIISSYFTSLFHIYYRFRDITRPSSAGYPCIFSQKTLTPKGTAGRVSGHSARPFETIYHRERDSFPAAFAKRTITEHPGVNFEDARSQNRRNSPG